MSRRQPQTPGQTVGPFFGQALPYARGGELVRPGTPGAIVLTGRVTDGRGQPVPDALLELWQRDPDGQIVRRAGSLRRDSGTFTGWGRASTDSDGVYRFTTVRPGPGPDGRAFFSLTVFARGLLDALFTRAYLPQACGGSATGHSVSDLQSVDAPRRSSLIATATSGGYVFDVVLQGVGETPFFTYREPAARHDALSQNSNPG